MNRLAVFVDAGYFLTVSAQTLQGEERVSRGTISIIHPKRFMEELIIKAKELSDQPQLLRTYWYDAQYGNRLFPEQSTIAYLSNVKLRLGTVNSMGQQKGVDSLIVTDLVELSRNRAMSDAVIVSGDEDLRTAIVIAQSYGVRVHILSVGDEVHNVSTGLQMEADTLGNLSTEWLRLQLHIRDREFNHHAHIYAGHSNMTTEVPHAPTNPHIPSHLNPNAGHISQMSNINYTNSSAGKSSAGKGGVSETVRTSEYMVLDIREVREARDIPHPNYNSPLRDDFYAMSSNISTRSSFYSNHSLYNENNPPIGNSYPFDIILTSVLNNLVHDIRSLGDLEKLKSLFTNSTSGIPHDYDSRLLTNIARQIQRALTDEEKRRARSELVILVQNSY